MGKMEWDDAIDVAYDIVCNMYDNDTDWFMQNMMPDEGIHDTFDRLVEEIANDLVSGRMS